MLNDWLNYKLGKTKWKVLDLLVVVLAVVFGVWMRVVFISLKFPDYTVCLKPWVDAFREYGGFAGLAYEIGNYTPAYMHFLALFSYFDIEPLYLIKALGIMLDVVLAFVGCRLIAHKGEVYQQILMFMAIFMLPTVFVNSGVWGQCDNIYAIFILAALYCAVEDREIKLPLGKTTEKKAAFCLKFLPDDQVMFFLGCAFAFKLQTIFLIAVLAVIFVKKNYRLRTLFWVPAVYFITMIPSLIAGRGWKDLLTIYFRQTGDFTELNLKFPNIYSFWQFEGLDNEVSMICILFCIMGLMVFVYYLLQQKIDINVEFVCKFTTFSVLFITFFLPRMHDRYAYVAEIASLYYLAREKKKLWIPIVLSLIAIESYSETLFWFSFDGWEPVAALIRAAMIVIVGMDVMKLKECSRQ